MSLSTQPLLIRFLKTELPYMLEGQLFTLDDVIPDDIKETEYGWELENGLIEELPVLKASGVVIRLDDGRLQIGSNIKEFTRLQVELLEAQGFIESVMDEEIYRRLKDSIAKHPGT